MRTGPFGVCCMGTAVGSIVAQPEGNPTAPVSTFVDEPPVSSKGGTGVVKPGCSTCRKRADTINEFLEHTAYDAIPPLIERLSQILER
jgi:hypothetical protein